MTPTYASVGRRLVAFAVDYMVIAIYIVALTFASLSFGGGSGGWLDTWFADPVTAQILGFLTLTLPAGSYFALMETSRWQATLGKRLLRIEVQARDGGRLALVRGFVRAGGKLLPWEIAHGAIRRIPAAPAPVESLPPGVVASLVLVWILVAAYVLLAAVSRSRQTPYDRLAQSIVVRPA